MIKIYKSSKYVGKKSFKKEFNIKYPLKNLENLKELNELI